MARELVDAKLNARSTIGRCNMNIDPEEQWQTNNIGGQRAMERIANSVEEKIKESDRQSSRESGGEFQICDGILAFMDNDLIEKSEASDTEWNVTKNVYQNLIRQAVVELDNAGVLGGGKDWESKEVREKMD